MLPRYARCVLSRLRCNGHSLLLGSYLSRIGRIENPSCSACGHSSQDISHLVLRCPAMDSLRRSLFGDSLSLYDLWSSPGGLPSLWGSIVFHYAPIPRKGSGNQQQQQQHVFTRENGRCGGVKQWLKRKEKIKYLSPATTNEILNDFSRSVLNDFKILNDFSLSCNKTFKKQNITPLF